VEEVTMRRFLLMLLVLVAPAGAQAPALPPDYDQKLAVLEQARQATPGDLGVLEALAGSYAMGGRYAQAIETLRAMLPLTASDPGRHAEVELRLARNQAWSGDTAGAIESYEVHLKGGVSDRTATIELVRLYRYRGSYAAAERLCNRLLEANPQDAEVLALKAEVLHWAGDRRASARAAAGQAVKLAPELPEARVAQVYALRDLGQNRAARQEYRTLADQVSRLGGVTPQAGYAGAYQLFEREMGRPARLSVEPEYSGYNDSDGIHDAFYGFRMAGPWREDHALRLDVRHYHSSAPRGGPFTAAEESAGVNEFSAGGSFLLAPAVRVSAAGGASRRLSGGGTRPTFDLALEAAPLDRWTFDAEAGREFLKLTPRAIDLDMSSYRVGGGVRYAFDSRMSLAARAERRFWSDDNRSTTTEAVFRRILHYYRPFMVDGGVETRWESFERDTRLAAGFFTPEQYLRHAAFLGLHGELNHRLTYEVRGAAGAQQLAAGADYHSAWEFSAAADLRITRSLGLYAGYQRRNYSLLTRNGGYHGFYVSLAVRP
jgi:tetratricopeptide (TPR) repeat protein